MPNTIDPIYCVKCKKVLPGKDNVCIYCGTSQVPPQPTPPKAREEKQPRIVQCPHCGSTRVIWQEGQNANSFACCSCLLGCLVSVFALLLLPFIHMMKDGEWLCCDCGFRWR